MLNVLGGHKVYTVPEIDKLLRNACGFVICTASTFPKLEDASTKLVYYKQTNDTIAGYCDPDNPDDIVTEPDEKHTEPVKIPTLTPYLKGKDADEKDCWYTTDKYTLNDTLTEEEVLAIWNKYDWGYEDDKDINGHTIKQHGTGTISTTKHLIVKSIVSTGS